MPRRFRAGRSKGLPVHRRLLLWLAPIALAATTALAAPDPVAAATPGLTETGTTVYEIDPDKAEIHVSVELSIHNSKADTTESCGYLCTRTVTYSWNQTNVLVLASATNLTATSDAGQVTHAVNRTEGDLKLFDLTYPSVYNGQTRKITVRYTIPASLQTPGDARAGKAYASLCAVGNGADTGSVSVVLPDGYDVNIDAGGQLLQHAESDGKQVLSTGEISEPFQFWTCLDAQDQKNYLTSSMTAGNQVFDIQAWPEDAAWANLVQTYVVDDVPRLQELTGLPLPGNRITIREAGNVQLGEYAGLYDSKTRTATIGENVDPATVAHELSHVWFNRDLFSDIWMDEGFAGYSMKAAGSGDYKPCTDPGTYPGSGSPDLVSWKQLDINSTTQDVDVSDYQYAASCFIVTRLADDMGPINFKNVLAAAASGKIAYVGGSPVEDSPLVGPVSAKALVDLIDEQGMVPAGIADLDEAQSLFAKYGIFTDPNQLHARSDARATYRDLLTAAGTWKLPYAIREPMAAWDFGTAKTAMGTGQQIIELRDQIGKEISDFSLDGTTIQQRFESAQNLRDLDDLLVVIRKEAGAASKVAQATKAAGESRSLLQSIGLLGTDIQTPLDRSKEALRRVEPDDAATAASTVIDRIGGSNEQGLLRVATALGTVLALVLVATLFLVWRRRRHVTVVVVAGATPPALLVAGPPSDDPTRWTEPPWSDGPPRSDR